MKTIIVAVFLTAVSFVFPAFAATGTTELSATTAEVREVKIIFSKDYPASLKIYFEKSKTDELDKFLLANIGKNVDVIVFGKLMGSPVVKMSINYLPVSAKSAEECTEIAKKLVGKGPYRKDAIRITVSAKQE